ncbi:MAG: exosortase-associated EpsI family protein [Verrucomicrobiota bacterium]|jgi:hypothetical protein
MKHQKWLILFIVLVLMGGTAGALTWLKRNQRLGQPGVKATPIAGSTMMKIDLPEHVLDFTSTNVPESEVELGYFPKDTSYVRRLYQVPDGFWVSAIIILMGADRTSIHRPEYCMLGQGWNVDEKTKVKIPIAGVSPYDLPVMKWVVSKTFSTPGGQKQEVRGVYVFWFVADHEQTTGNVQLQCYLMKDLLFTGVLQRWAYITYFSVCAPGQEDATFERMKKLIAASVPEYQFPPVQR